jgi:hypothetical protein
MEDAFAEVLREQGQDLIPLVAIVMTMITGMVISLIIGWVVVRNGRERERSRREIAAYVAEGSIDPADAERILAPSPWYSREAGAAMKNWRVSCHRKGWREGPAPAAKA